MAHSGAALARHSGRSGLRSRCLPRPRTRFGRVGHRACGKGGDNARLPAAYNRAALACPLAVCGADGMRGAAQRGAYRCSDRALRRCAALLRCRRGGRAGGGLEGGGNDGGIFCGFWGCRRPRRFKASRRRVYQLPSRQRWRQFKPSRLRYYLLRRRLKSSRRGRLRSGRKPEESRESRRLIRR